MTLNAFLRPTALQHAFGLSALIDKTRIVMLYIYAVQSYSAVCDGKLGHKNGRALKTKCCKSLAHQSGNSTQPVVD